MKTRSARSLFFGIDPDLSYKKGKDMESKIKEKNWSKEMERPIYESWKSQHAYKFDDKGRVFSIDTPPPYVNTPVHIGHAATYTLMDMFARFHRMVGDSVLFPLGLDRNGLPIEMATEKKFSISMTKLPREKFIEYCKKLLEESSSESIDSFMKLGISFNSWKLGHELGDIYYTDSPEYRALTQATFIDMWNKKLIYEDSRINNFCPGCRTTIADAEIEYADLPSTFNDIIFKVEETGDEIIIPTTRPELICTCAMIIFNPDDERYRHLGDKYAITPLFNKKVPIRAHPFADMEKGTGLMMMCSMGDQTDIRFFREMSLSPTIAIGIDGKMNRHAGFLEGLSVKEARETIIQKLKGASLLTKQRHLSHRTPICERSKHPIEFIAMPEYYVKQVEFKRDMKKVSDHINFFAPHSKQILSDWIDSVSIDWPVSRRRYYATEIPIWHCKKCHEIVLGERGKYVQPWRESPHMACQKCKSTDFVGEERVLDTWFDSANSPLYIMKYGTKFFDENHPCTLRPQGREIVRTWLYYTLLKAKLLTNKPIFKDAWIHYHIVDEKGKKMSKSVGNVIDPHDIIEKFGAEPFRLWCAVEGSITEGDLKCSHERIQGAGKTLTKLWNVARFISMFREVKEAELTPLDMWIISELNGLAEYSKEHYENYDFHNPATKIKHFIWETFASHYIELVKNRAYNEHGLFSKAEQDAAIFTLYHCLDTILRLLAPVTPFITEKLYREIRGGDVHSSEFPRPFRVKHAEFLTGELVELNSRIWKEKKDRNLSLKAGIKSAVIPERFRSVEKDLKAAHSIIALEYGDELELEL